MITDHTYYYMKYISLQEIHVITGNTYYKGMPTMGDRHFAVRPWVVCISFGAQEMPTTHGRHFLYAQGNADHRWSAFPLHQRKCRPPRVGISL